MGKLKIKISPDYKDNKTVTDFIGGLTRTFEKKGTVLYNKRNVIKRYVIDSSDNILKEVVVKRYKYPNLVQRIAYSFFRSSKAKRAFYNAEELRHRGIDTPKEIAYIEQWGILFHYGYYISGSDNAPPIKDELIEPENFNRTMAADFAAFAAELHKKGILHHDLNSTNVLYHPYGEHYTFSVIDINRMDFYSDGDQIPKKECFENLTRFTGKMDLFEFVARHYAEARGWDIEKTTQDAIKQKVHHDEQWRKRKAFLRKLSFRKKK